MIRRPSVLEEQINARLRSGSVPYEQLRGYSLGPSPDEADELPADHKTLLPEIDPVTNSIFRAEINQLCFVVLFESFDDKNLCLNSMYSIATESSKRLRVMMYVSYHPDDYELAFMQHMRNLDDPELSLIMDACSASENDTGRAMTVGWALSDLFGMTTVSQRLNVVLCCGKDIEHNTAKEMYDYVQDRHPCYLVYGSEEMRTVASSVNFFSKWKLRNVKAQPVASSSGSINA